MSDRIKIIDDKQERETALDCTKSIHCESPAGAGKTTLLTNRFLKLLAGVEHPLQILALTFTNKAAGEMRSRISNALRKAEQADEKDLNAQSGIARKVLDRHKNNRHLLYSPDGLRIMTFHSLCYTIVRTSPLEAQLPSEISIIEGVEYDALLREVTDETLSRIGALEKWDPRRTALENWLLRSNNSWPRLRSDCINLIKRRDYLKDLIAVVSLHPDMSAFRERLNHGLGSLIDRFLGKTRDTLLKTDLGEKWPDFSRCLDTIPGAPFLNNPENPLPVAEWSNLREWKFLADLLTTKEGKPRKKFSQGPAFMKCIKEIHADQWISALTPQAYRMLQDLKALPVNGYDENHLQSVYDLVILLGEIIASWQDACCQRGVIDFVGLELACLKVFKSTEIPDIQLILDSRINHILIDEFQDTSRHQWELLQSLCAGWTRGDGRTLFVVGDPKQSIYGFRKAEVSLFLESKNGLPLPGQGRLSLDPITLKHNFRSKPGLVEWTNHIFADTVMANPRADVDEVPYSPATASMEGEHRLSMSLFIQTEAFPDPYLAEARWLSRFVSNLDAELDKKERIGILLFARTRIPLYIQAFRDIGLPVMITEGLSLMDRIEVLGMHHMVRALVRPHDDLAYVSILRSPWFWCNPDILCGIRREAGPGWVDKIDHFLNSGKGQEMKTWWEIFKRARNRVGRAPLSDIAKNAWLEIDGAYKLAGLLGAEAVANVMKYLELLEASEMRIPEESLEKVENALENAYLPSPPEASRSKVSIMTVHRAKGLEFDHVFCPFLDWDPLGGGRFDQPAYLMEAGFDDEGILAVRKDQRQDSEDAIYRLLRARGNEKRIAEAKRVFYVAVTRAKKGLYLSGVSTHKNGKISVRCKVSPLSYLIKHEGIGEWEPGPNELDNVEKTGDSGLPIRINPLLSLEKHPACAPPPLPEPLPIVPEPLSYQIITPSGIKADESLSISSKGPSGKRDALHHERIRGVIIHRILAGISNGSGLPSEKAVRSALYKEGIRSDEAGPLADSILKEIMFCLEEKTCAWILGKDHQKAYSEWRIEDHPSEAIIRSGTIDRLIFDGKTWWIVDYKTVQMDGEDADPFIQEQAAIYKPQMLSYREMIAGYFNTDPADIVLLLYFTAMQKSYIYPQDSMNKQPFKI
ncbi:MAG: UvrD-helicase domain-containing protein [bacterium]